MKVQLIILSLFVSIALALPVPDEEVSPVKAVPVGEIKSELADDKQVVKQPAVDVAVKPEARASEDQKQPLNLESKLEAEKVPAKPALNEEKPTLLLGTPDAELAQSLPEQKIELKEKEKNLRADNQVAETKALPTGIVQIPVVPSAVEEQKQIVEEDKPSVQDIQPAGKSADLTAAPATIVDEKEAKVPEATADSVADAVVPSASEVKTEESPARQERGNEQKTEQVVAAESAQINAEVPVAAEAASAGNSAEAPAIKILKEEQSEKQGEASTPVGASAAAAPVSIPAPAPELKAAAPQPEKQATTGDISKQSSEESNIKALPNEVAADTKLPLEAGAAPSAEAKKIEEAGAGVGSTSAGAGVGVPSADAATAAIQPAEPLAQQQKEIPIQASEIQPLKKIEGVKDSSEERKDSAESKESAESDEVKTKSDESKGQSDENKSN